MTAHCLHRQRPLRRWPRRKYGRRKNERTSGARDAPQRANDLVDGAAHLLSIAPEFNPRDERCAPSDECVLGASGIARQGYAVAESSASCRKSSRCTAAEYSSVACERCSAASCPRDPGTECKAGLVVSCRDRARRNAAYTRRMGKYRTVTRQHRLTLIVQSRRLLIRRRSIQQSLVSVADPR